MGQLPPRAHGTTCIGLRFADGALVAGDRLATMGYQVASRDIQKVYATDDYSLMAIAGAAGPAIEMARLLGIQFEHHEKIEGEPLELEGKANTLSQLIRQNLPAAMQGLVVVPIFAGYDRRRHTRPRLALRGHGRPLRGARVRRGRLRLDLRAGVAEEELPARARRATRRSAWRSRRSRTPPTRTAAPGGVDLERNIYPDHQDLHGRRHRDRRRRRDRARCTARCSSSRRRPVEA